MMTAILKIMAVVLNILDRYLEEQARTRTERENEEFKKGLARNDLELVADRLGKRLREFKRNHLERQGTDIPPSNKP